MIQARATISCGFLRYNLYITHEFAIVFDSEENLAAGHKQLRDEGYIVVLGDTDDRELLVRLGGLGWFEAEQKIMDILPSGARCDFV